MRIFMFTSQAKDGLNAFAGDAEGSKLPERYGPWGITGVLQTRQNPPHNFSRRDIESAIGSSGFQLWRTKAASEAAAAAKAGASAAAAG